MATPHISCENGDFAKTVLMPGDPLRAEFVAKNFLTSARLVNNVRGVNGYTGEYNGTRVSVMASGMGMPSIGIYSYELFSFFGVQNIVRIGSAGAIDESLALGDICAGIAACTDSGFGRQYGLCGTAAPAASYELLRTADDISSERGTKLNVGTFLSSDVFYADMESNLAWGKLGVLCVEMEAAALYLNAARLGKRALAICTVSDVLRTGEAATPSERETGFTEMMSIALELAVRAESLPERVVRK